MKKRFLSLLLAVLMVVSLVPTMGISTSAANGDAVNYTVKHVLHYQDGTTEEQTSDEQTLQGVVGGQSAAVALTTATYTDYTPATIEQITLGETDNVVTVDYYQCNYIVQTDFSDVKTRKGNLTKGGWFSINENSNFEIYSGGYYEFTVFVPQTLICVFDFSIKTKYSQKNVSITSNSMSSNISGYDSERFNVTYDGDWKDFSVQLYVPMYQGYNTVRINSPSVTMQIYNLKAKIDDTKVMYGIDCVLNKIGATTTTQSTYYAGDIGSNVTFQKPEITNYTCSSAEAKITLSNNVSDNKVTEDYYSTDDVIAVLAKKANTNISTKYGTVTSGYKYANGKAELYNNGKISFNVYLKDAAYYSFKLPIKATTAQQLTVKFINSTTNAETTSNISLSQSDDFITYTGLINVPNSGYYTIELCNVSTTVTFDTAIEFYGHNGQPVSYSVKHYIDGTLEKEELLNGEADQQTNATVYEEYLESGQYVPFSNYALTTSNNPDINIYYYKNGFLSFNVNDIKINVTNVDNELYLLLPGSTGLNNVSVTSIKSGTLTVDGVQYNLQENVAYTGIDISAAASITFASAELGLSNSAITVKKSENIESVYFTLDKCLHTITKDDSTAATGTFSMIDENGILKTFNGKTSLTVNEFLKRGNTSYNNADGKYPFKFKLSEKAALVQDYDGNDVNGKSWVLIYNSFQEKTCLGTIAGLHMYQALEGDNAISYKLVNVYVDGNYRGIYVLAEKSTAEAKDNITLADDPVLSTDHEVEIDDTNVTYSTDTTSNGATYRYCSNGYSTDLTGFVVEIGGGSTGTYIQTNRGCFYEIKEPNYPTQNQVENFATYIQNFEDALFAANGYNSLGKHYSEYVDLDSLAKTFIVKIFMNDTDYMSTSTYFAVDVNMDGTYSPLVSGNLWDTSLNPDKYSHFDTNSYSAVGANYIKNFLNKGDFLAKIYSLIPNFLTASDSVLRKESTYLANTISLLNTVYDMDNTLYERNLNVKAASYILNFNEKIVSMQSWWSDTTSALRGVTASNNNGTLTANAVGDASYQWYKLDADGYTGTVVAGATSATYTPIDGGTYYVTASGTALTGNAFSSTISSNPIETTAEFNDASISLKDNTWLNFYTYLTDDNYADYHFTYTVNGGEEIAVDSSMVLRVNNEWRVSIALLPYQLADEITVTMYNSSNVVVSSRTDSVQDYAQRRLENSSNENFKAALRALLNYGAAVQTWQNYNTENLANSILNP